MVYIKLFRVKHYIKNILILLPLFFSLNLFVPRLFIFSIFGFISFCLLTSTVYIINDIKDKEEDAKHPTKKYRPIASNKISTKKAFGLAIAAIILAFASTIYLSILINQFSPLMFAFLYFANNILYSNIFKKYTIFDILSIAFGFLLRVLYGAAIIYVEVSPFLYLTILSFSMYLGYGKRKGELRNKHIRQVLKKYSQNFLEKYMTIYLALTLVFYSVWALNIGENYLVLKITMPVVMFILMRYSIVIDGDSEGDPVEVIFKDKMLVFSSITYIAILAFLLYI
ncbi:MAG: UbiA prenyltransferase family protein [Defluviitaleaceae bacterium]|nr:UbiA prenyltransferase family protein [Defluviitaleaceae bacterium]